LRERYSNPREGDDDLVHYQLLEKAIRKFCDNLPAPITLHESPSDETGALVNSQKAPWDEKEPSIETLQEYLKKREEPFGDIAYIRRFVFTSKSDGIDARGVVYFPKGEEGFDLIHGRYPDVLFLRRMYVTTGLPDLLPSWLLFAGVIAECPELPLNLSRDRVVEHAENFVRLAQRLSEFIVETCATWTRESTFASCYDNNVGRFTESIANSHMKEPNSTLFRVLVPALSFDVRCSTRTQGGKMTLEQYEEFVKGKPRPKLEQEHKTLFLYLLTREDQGRLRAVAVEQPYPVLYLDSGTQGDIIRAYATLEKGNYACDIRDLYPGKPVDEEPYQRLRALCFALRTRLAINEVKIREFSPSYIPALLISGSVDQRAAQAIDDFIEQRGSFLPANIVSDLQHQAVSIRSGRLSFTLYLNASNVLINQLVRELELQPHADETIERVVNELILSSALPLFEDPKLTEDLMRDRGNNTLDLLGADKKLDEKRQENTLLEAECNRRLDPQHALDVSQIPEKAQKRDCAVLILDLIKSTWVLGNLDIEEGGSIFEEFVDMVARLVRESGGHFDKFTGDGVLAEFFPADEKDEKSCQKAARDAFECAKTVANEIDNFFNRDPWRQRLADAGLSGPKTRSALAWGHVNFGRYSSAGTAVGAPMVIAARLCDWKDFFTKTKDRPEARIIGTKRICELIRLDLAEARHRLVQENWPVEGLTPVDVFRLDP
jgi:class 3 adenylate cyclase